MTEVSKIKSAPTVQWPEPIINNPSFALEDASCMMERLIALHERNNADFAEAFVDTDLDGEGINKWLRTRAYSLWMIDTVIGEKLSEFDRLLQAIINSSTAVPTSSVGKHVDIQLRSAWIAAANAYKAAEAVPVDDSTDNSIANSTWDAFCAMLNTRAPDLRCLHEKMSLISQAGGWATDGIVDAIMSDVEHLARRYEVARPQAEDVPLPAEWQSAIDEYNCARWVEQAHPEPATRFDDPLYEALKQDNIRAFKRVKDALQAVMQLPAPSTVAAADKLQAVIDFYPDADPALIEHLNTIAAEIRVLGKGG